MKTRPKRNLNQRNPIVRDMIANPKRNAGRHASKKGYEKIPNNVRSVRTADYIKRLDMEEQVVNSGYEPMTAQEMESLQQELYEFFHAESVDEGQSK